MRGPHPEVLDLVPGPFPRDANLVDWHMAWTWEFFKSVPAILMCSQGGEPLTQRCWHGLMVLLWSEPLNSQCCGWTSPCDPYDCKTSFSNNLLETLKRYRFIIYKTWSTRGHTARLSLQIERVCKCLKLGRGWRPRVLKNHSVLVNLKQGVGI